MHLLIVKRKSRVEERLYDRWLDPCDIAATPPTSFIVCAGILDEFTTFLN